jgi:hypothetical protein
MLAYLIDEQAAIDEPAALDATLAVPVPDDQGLCAQVAYEAAQRLESERWIPKRRHGLGARPDEVLG